MHRAHVTVGFAADKDGLFNVKRFFFFMSGSETQIEVRVVTSNVSEAVTMGQWWVMGQSSRWLVGGHRKKTQPVVRHK